MSDSETLLNQLTELKSEKDNMFKTLKAISNGSDEFESKLKEANKRIEQLEIEQINRNGN